MKVTPVKVSQYKEGAAVPGACRLREPVCTLMMTAAGWCYGSWLPRANLSLEISGRSILRALHTAQLKRL